MTKTGYNMLNKRAVTDSSAIPSSNCNGTLCQTWDTPQKAADFLGNVIGEQTLTTCQENCGTQSGAKAGVGLTPAIEDEHAKKVTLLEKALNADPPSNETLVELSTNTIPVTRGLLEALRGDPDVEALSQRLAGDLARTDIMEKMLLARRAVIAGMREPNVAASPEAQRELERILIHIDREISQVKLEDEMQKSVTGGAAKVILENKMRRDVNTKPSSESKDDTDKRINDLDYGTPQRETEDDEISIPTDSISLGLPTTYSVVPLIPDITDITKTKTSTGATTNSTSRSSYPSVKAISGSAATQASALLRQFEGFISTPDYDVNALRVGYGSDTVTYADGRVAKVTAGMKVSREDAERDLARRTQIFANTAKNQVSASTWNALPASAQAVLTSYIYNYGSLNKTPSVIRAAQQSAQSGDMTALATAIRNRQVDNGGVNARRRNQEADYILNNSGGSNINSGS